MLNIFKLFRRKSSELIMKTVRLKGEVVKVELKEDSNKLIKGLNEGLSTELLPISELDEKMYGIFYNPDWVTIHNRLGLMIGYRNANTYRYLIPNHTLEITKPTHGYKLTDIDTLKILSMVHTFSLT